MLRIITIKSETEIKFRKGYSIEALKIDKIKGWKYWIDEKENNGR